MEVASCTLLSIAHCSSVECTCALAPCLPNPMRCADMSIVPRLRASCKFFAHVGCPPESTHHTRGVLRNAFSLHNFRDGVHIGHNQETIGGMGDITTMLFPCYARAHAAKQLTQPPQVRQVR